MKISIELEALTGTFVTDFARARKSAEKDLKELQKRAEQAGKVIGTAIGLAATAAAGGLALMVRDALNAADELGNLSEKTGVAVEALSELQFAATQSDVSAETLSTSLIKLNDSIAQASTGAKAQSAAFDALGVSVTDSSGAVKDGHQVLLEIADAFKAAKDDASQTAVAIDIFGKAGAEMIPLLNAGAEGIREFEQQARDLGLTITNETAQAADQFDKNLNVLKASFTGVGRSIAADLAPALVDLTSKVNSPAFREGLKEIVGLAISATQAIAGLVQRVGTMPDTRNLEKLTREAAFLRDTIERRTNGRGILGLFGRDVDAELAQLQTRLAAVNAEIAGLEAKKASIDPALLSEAEALEKGIAAKTVAAQKSLDYAGAVEKAGNASKKAAANVDLFSASLDAAAAIAAEAEALLGPLEAEAARVFENTRTPLENFNSEIERLNRLRNTFVNGKPLIDADTYARAVAQAQDSLDSLSKKTKETTSSMSVFADQAARNMQDAFADFLFDPFSRGLDGMLADFADILQRMAAEAAAAQIFESLGFGGTAGASGGGGVDWGSVLGSIGSGIASAFGGFGISSSGTVTRDSGGMGMAGRPYLIGTGAQPEMFIPSSNGTFVPAGDWMGKGDTHINITIPISAPTGSVGQQTLAQIQSAAYAGASMAAARDR